MTKRFFAIMLVLFLVLPAFAQAEDVSLSSAIVYTGKGTQILDGISLPFSPAIFVGKSTKEIEVSLVTGDTYLTYHGRNSSSYQFAHLLTDQTTFSSILVETQGEWALTFSPVGTVDQLSFTGCGASVTDWFYATPPCIVSISFTSGEYGGYTYIYLYKKLTDGTLRLEEWMWQDLITSDETFDYIIKPEAGVESYLIRITCPHDTEWTIAPK